MAVVTSTGVEVQRSLATVVIGGLITSTLLLLPALYGWFERDKEKDEQREEKTDKTGELSQARNHLLS